MQKIFAMTQFYSLTVSNIKKLTPNSAAISLRVPESLRDVFSFSAGQYLTVRHPVDGSEIRRAYSLCSKPGETEITIGVKKVPGGTFSVYANEVLRVDDILEVMPPEGRFTFEPEAMPGRIIAFAAGSGITPLMSIIRTALEAHPDNQVVLVYGNQSRSETMFYGELNALQSKYSDRFFIQYLFSRNQEPEGMFGRIDKSIVNYILRNKHKDLNPDRFYLCGPLPMIETVRETLAENGVPADQIHQELFTTPEKEDTLKDTLQGVTQLQVTLDDRVHTLQMDQKSIVLDAVLGAGIDAPYSCQGGVCSTCIARVTGGSAKMVKNQNLTDSELEEGFILTCQAHPTSAELRIDYDDV